MQQVKSLCSVLSCVSVLCISLSSSLIAQETKPMEVEGTVVDEQGRPIDGATVYPLTYIQERSASDDDDEPRTEAIFGISSLEDGYFGIEFNWRPGTIARIWIEAPRPADCWSPIGASTASLELHKNPGLEGILVKDYAPLVQLGRVNSVIHYYIVEIDLQDAPGEFLRDASAMKVMMVIRDSFGNVVSTTSINRALRMEPLRLELCFPQGTWSVGFKESSDYEFIGFPRKITVSKANPSIQIQPTFKSLKPLK